ncbi:MAG: hypothetical protein KJ630_19050 [Proteobacteria bacterium]|nr:hypothetical protein [Pseudomonadota bacterium]
MQQHQNKNSLLPDLLAIGGLCSISYGLWMVAPWLSLVVTGSISLLLGLLGHLSSPKVA